MKSIADFFVQVFRSVIKASSAPASASTLERIFTPTLSLVGLIVVTAAVYRFSDGTPDEVVIRIAYLSCVFVFGPLGFYLRDRWD